MICSLFLLSSVILGRFNEFLNEDLIAPCENRKEILPFLRDFIESEYTVVQAAHEWLYVKDEAFEENFKMEYFLERYAKEGSTVVDFGAQFGAYTVALSRFVGLQGRVLSFEMDRCRFRELFWNAQLNNVQNAQLFFSERMLDSLELTDVSLVILDAHGREDVFLRGAKKTIQRCKPAIILNIVGGVNLERRDRYVKEEYDNRIEKFRELGYSLRPIDSEHYLALPIGSRSPEA